MHKLLNSTLILRVSAGLFFLIPGLFKVASPGDFTEFLSFFPAHFDSISHGLFWLVTVLQITGGLALLSGKQFRMFTLPLAVVAIVALLTTVPQDTGSALQYVALLTHVMTFGIFIGLFLIGPSGKDWTEMIHAKDADRGWDLVRISLAWFWLGMGMAIWFAPQLLSKAAGIMPVDLGFWGYALAGLISLKVGMFLLIRFYTKKVALASIIGFAALLMFLAVPDMANSKIGLINLLFMVLGLGSSTALALKECNGGKKTKKKKK